MAGFVKLHSSILRSTIWFARPDREVFLTALLVAEPIETTEPLEQLEARSLTATGWVIPPGRYGFCEASGAGIIRLAGVELDQGFEALERLSSPEPESRSASFGGRRLARVDGGWIVLNLFKYRDKDGTAPERAKRYREKKKSRSNINESRTDRDVTRDITHAEAEAEAEAERDPPIAPQGAVQFELGLETVPSEGEHRIANSLPLEQSRMRQNERSEGGELPEGTPTPKTRQRGSQTAKRAKEPKPPKPVETDPPDDFAPNEATLAAATESGRDWRSDWVQCRDWHLANGKRKVDWQATLRGWMRRDFGKAADQPRIEVRKPPPPTNDPWWHWETTRGAPHWREVEILKRNELERRERAKGQNEKRTP